ncbi:hypothetical protein EJB05_35286, partial [Eragrostis curvula]
MSSTFLVRGARCWICLSGSLQWALGSFSTNGPANHNFYRPGHARDLHVALLLPTRRRAPTPIGRLAERMAMAAVRRALLAHLRVPMARPAAAAAAAAVSVPGARRLLSTTEEGKGSFLDKGEVADRVVSVVKNFQKVEPAKVTPAAHFQKDLGLDSLDTVEIVMAFEEEFGFEIPDNEAEKIDSIKTAVDFIASHPQAK